MVRLNFFSVSRCVLCVILYFICFVVRANSVQICVRSPPLENIASFHAPSFYKFLCGTKLFIDHSEFITHIANGDEVDRGVEVISFPRRFGKSLNILMIKFFFEIVVFPNNTEVPREMTDSYRFFTVGKFKNRNGNEVQFTPAPLISDPKYKNIVQMHCAKHPVIHLDFKSINLRPSSLTYDNFLLKFGTVIQTTFESHIYLDEYLIKKVNTALSVHQRKSAENDLDFFFNGKCNKLDSNSLKQSIQKLSEILKERFSNRNVIILIDEYDQVINQLLFHGNKFPSKLREDILAFYGDFYSFTLTANANNYNRVILTGVINYREASIFSGLNYLSYYHMFSPNVNKYYGISISEADVLFDIYQIENKKREDIKSYYYGYKFPTGGDDGMFETYYNIFSIINYLNNARFTLKPDGYWTGSGIIDGNFRKMMMFRSVRTELEPLVLDNRHPLTINYANSNEFISEYFTFSSLDLRSSEEMFISQLHFETANKYHAYMFFKLLLATGYLTWNGGSIPPKFVFPNVEVSMHMLQQLKIEYENTFGPTYTKLAETLETFLFDDNVNAEKLVCAFSEFTIANEHKLVLHRSPSDLKKLENDTSSTTTILPGKLSTIKLNEAYFATVLRAAALWIKWNATFVAFEHQVKGGKLYLYFHNYKDRQAIIELKYEGSHYKIGDVSSQMEKYYTNKTEYKCKFIAILGKLDGSIDVQAQFERPKNLGEEPKQSVL